jgi:hypothetical protein
VIYGPINAHEPEDNFEYTIKHIYRFPDADIFVLSMEFEGLRYKEAFTFNGKKLKREYWYRAGGPEGTQTEFYVQR